MFTYLMMQTITSLEPKDIRFVLRTLLDRPTSDTTVTAEEALCLCLYDMLSQMQYKTEDISAIIKAYKDRIFECGRMYANTQSNKKVKIQVLLIADGRYAVWGGNAEGIYDFKEMVWLEQLPIPVWTLSIVLPRLYQRVIKAAGALDRRREQAEAEQHLEIVDGAFPE